MNGGINVRKQKQEGLSNHKGPQTLQGFKHFESKSLKKGLIQTELMKRVRNNTKGVGNNLHHLNSISGSSSSSQHLSALRMEQARRTQTSHMNDHLGQAKKRLRVTRTVTLGWLGPVIDNKIDDVLQDELGELEDIGTNLENAFFTKRNIENGQVLDYERKDGSSVHMNIHLGVRMQILIKVSWSTKIVPLDVHSWDTVQDVKTKFQEKEGTPANQLSLIYLKQLEDFKTLEAYGIEDGFTLYAVSLGEEKFEISIKMPEGETVQVAVKLCSSVQNVKSLLECMMGFPVDQQKLTFNGVLLKNSSTLADYKIQKDSLLEFTFGIPGVINITVKLLNGRHVIVYVNRADTINDIKTKVNYKEGIPEDQQILLLAGLRLSEKRTVEDCNIQKGCNVQLIVNQCGC